jgi:septum site-determining protein MinC
VFKVSVDVKSRISFRLLGRSFLAFMLTPERPIKDWLLELDRRVQVSLGFFANRPLVLDLSAIGATKAEAMELVARIEDRNLRLVAVEGVNPEWLPPRFAPMPGKIQPVGMFSPPETPVKPKAENWPSSSEAPSGPGNPCAALLIEEPVRSGQTIIFPEGDVTIVGSVASGAEIIAGGSIHVYGTLRGRAFAGTNGNTSARIFCSKFYAEIMVIDGLYKTADEFDHSLRGAPVQARLDRDVMNIEAMY